jgi:hypothetical protein
MISAIIGAPKLRRNYEMFGEIISDKIVETSSFSEE